MTDRPATLDDMRRFWPDKTDDELRAAADAIAAAGGTLTVGPAGDNSSTDTDKLTLADVEQQINSHEAAIASLRHYAEAGHNSGAS